MLYYHRVNNQKQRNLDPMYKKEKIRKKKQWRLEQ